MAETKKQNTETHNNPVYNMPNFDAFTHMAPFVQDGLDRLQALYEELATLEQSTYDRSKQMSNQLSDMVMGTLDYAAALAREWRQISLETTQRTAKMFSA